jgi:hypothetical protein
MKNTPSKWNSPRAKSVVVLMLAFASPCLTLQCIGQTNLTQSSGSQTNGYPYRLIALTDFQRLQYYYAAYPSSPAPGTEHAIFSVGDNGIWNGDWNSSTVPSPTRTQLSAITAQQVDIFRRAGVFTNGTWQIVTSATNIPLSSLSLGSSSYAQIRATADRDRILQQCHQFEQSSTATSLSISP